MSEMARLISEIDNELRRTGERHGRRDNSHGRIFLHVRPDEDADYACRVEKILPGESATTHWQSRHVLRAMRVF